MGLIKGSRPPRDNRSAYLLDVHTRAIPGAAHMRTYADDDEVDLCIVGAGPGGSVLAQRLVRKLCDHCREPVQADNGIAAVLGLDIGTVIWKPKGCEACGGTGFKGRVGVFEAIRVDETVRRYIYAGGDEAMIAKHAFLKAPTLASAARAMVAKGLTTPEEAIRIARREDVDA